MLWACASAVVTSTVRYLIGGEVPSGRPAAADAGVPAAVLRSPGAAERPAESGCGRPAAAGASAPAFARWGLQAARRSRRDGSSDWAVVSMEAALSADRSSSCETLLLHAAGSAAGGTGLVTRLIGAGRAAG